MKPPRSTGTASPARGLAGRGLVVALSVLLAVSVTAGRGQSTLTVTSVPLPDTPGAHAIWGATGQDSRGHIWIGVSSADTPEPSGHLLELDPATNAVTVRGNVVDELRKLNLLRPNEHQAKIHSKIIQGPDGCLYFSSMDEEGESESRQIPPVWGGHLWRLRQSTGRWEHLRATREALIAVGGGDRFIYALGYFGHVLYQYDTRTGAQRSLAVGSVDAHISRNLLVDYRGHVFVPRLRAVPLDGGKRRIDVSLVEFGTDLTELAATPIDADRYLEKDDATGSHGIIGLQTMADRSIYFTTHTGYLFHVVPPPQAGAAPSQAAARVDAIGWFHPSGPMYVPSLFTPDGTATLEAVAQKRDGYDWVTCDTGLKQCTTQPFEIGGRPGRIPGLMYGSSTRDAEGRHYVVGSVDNGRHGGKPEVLQVKAGGR